MEITTNAFVILLNQLVNWKMLKYFILTFIHIAMIKYSEHL